MDHTSAWKFNGEWYANATDRQDTAVGPFPTRGEALQAAEEIWTLIEHQSL